MRCNNCGRTIRYSDNLIGPNYKWIHVQVPQYIRCDGGSIFHRTNEPIAEPSEAYNVEKILSKYEN